MNRFRASRAAGGAVGAGSMGVLPAVSALLAEQPGMDPMGDELRKTRLETEILLVEVEAALVAPPLPRR
jgi:hypothetical protein